MLQQLGYIPNLLTLYRLIITIPAAYYLYIGDFSYAFFLYLSGIFTDFLDGFIARKFKMETQLGIILDPIADKLLILSYITVFYCKQFPYQPSKVLIFAFLLKEITVILGSFLILRKKRLPKPNLFGKMATTLLFLDGLILLYENWSRTNLTNFQHFVELLATVFLLGATVLYIKEGLSKLGKLP